MEQPRASDDYRAAGAKGQVSQMVTITAWCAAIIMGTMRPAISEEAVRTRPAVTPSDTVAKISEAAAPASRHAPYISNDTIKDSIARAVKVRDSTVHAMLAALEHDASLKALAREEPALPENPSQSVSDKISVTFGTLRHKAMQHRWILLAAVVAAGISTGVLILAAGRRSVRESRRFMTTTRLSLMDSEVQRACLFIEKNYMNPGLSPAVVCTAIITGVPFLETLFEKELGMSIGVYINQVRVHRAKLLVSKAPEKSGPEIAGQVGFSDAVAFETEFKSVTGIDFAAFCREKPAAS